MASTTENIRSFPMKCTLGACENKAFLCPNQYDFKNYICPECYFREAKRDSENRNLKCDTGGHHWYVLRGKVEVCFKCHGVRT